jgi:hypothetical protein
MPSESVYLEADMRVWLDGRRTNGHSVGPRSWSEARKESRSMLSRRSAAKSARKKRGKGSGRNRSRLGARGWRPISATPSCGAALSRAESRVRATILCVSPTRDRPRHTRSVHVAHTARERFWPGWEKEAVPPQLAEWPASPKQLRMSRPAQSHRQPLESSVGQCPRTTSCYPLRRRSRRPCLVFKTRGQSHLSVHDERLHQYLWPRASNL